MQKSKLIGGSDAASSVKKLQVQVSTASRKPLSKKRYENSDSAANAEISTAQGKRVLTGYGKFADVPVTVDLYLARKHAEIKAGLG